MSARADTNCHDIFNFVSGTWTRLAKIGATHRVLADMTRHVGDISSEGSDKMPRFTCYYEPMLKLLNYMHMGPKKYGQCPNVWVEDACKVLGSGFNV